MSELKAYIAPTADGTGLADYYLKSEADKVIAEKDKKIDLYKRGWEECDRINKHLYARLRHSNHTRCLAMAKFCDEVMMSCELRCYAVHRIWANKHQWAMRWKYRWLELAEKFKPNKSTAQQGKG